MFLLPSSLSMMKFAASSVAWASLNMVSTCELTCCSTISFQPSSGKVLLKSNGTSLSNKRPITPKKAVMEYQLGRFILGLLRSGEPGSYDKNHETKIVWKSDIMKKTVATPMLSRIRLPKRLSLFIPSFTLRTFCLSVFESQHLNHCRACTREFPCQPCVF